jgi:hypothetical protein
MRLEANGVGLEIERMISTAPTCECDDAESLKPLWLTPDALAAKLESLRITSAQWHTELKPERQAAFCRRPLGDEKQPRDAGVCRSAGLADELSARRRAFQIKLPSL